MYCHKGPRQRRSSHQGSRGEDVYGCIAGSENSGEETDERPWSELSNLSYLDNREWLAATSISLGIRWCS